MRAHELTGAMSDLAPTTDKASVGAEAVDPRIRVAVRDVDLAVRGRRRVGRMIERRLPMRRVPLAEPKEHSSVRGAGDHFVGVPVDEENAVARIDIDAVRVGDQPLAIGPQKLPVGPKDDDWRIPTSEAMNIAGAVDGDLTDHRLGQLGRRSTPVALDRISPPVEGHDA